MSLAYEHSKAMEALKSVDEKIKTNYSSSQYMEIMDVLLSKAINMLITHTNFLDRYVSGLMHHFTAISRRKITSLSKEKFMLYSVLFLAATDTKKKCTLYKKMKIERTITSSIIKMFLAKTENSETLSVHDLDDLKAHINVISTLSVFSLHRETAYWHKYYCDFRNKILQKYMRLIVTQAQKYYSMNSSRISLDTLIQNYAMYTLIAIDKFDPKQGTLTSYIVNWLNHAKNVTAVNEDNISFKLPYSKRTGEINNVSMSLDCDDVKTLESEDDVFSEIEVHSELEKTRWLAKLADPKGVARVALGIQDFLSKEQKRLQKTYSVK